jgi:hypothetical protein
MKAWLVTWEGWGIETEVAAIIQSRRDYKYLIEIVELIHASKMLIFSGQIEYAKSKKLDYNRAKYHCNGICYIKCGHNPHLKARKVDDISATIDGNGNEILTWIETLGDGKNERRQVIRKL